MRALAVCVLAISGIATADPLKVIDWPVRFDEVRTRLTLDYIERHYGFRPATISIVPRAIVIHWTDIPSLKRTWQAFNRVRLQERRARLYRAGEVNLSAHFLVDRRGTIYRLMPETWMARHCIGMNFDSIGIENVGGGSRLPLTDRQMEANVGLVRYLAKKYPIRFLLGHMESRRFEKSVIFRERDPRYRSRKKDPGRTFMRGLRQRLRDLDLLDTPVPEARPR